MEARDAMLKARDLFLKIGYADEFRALMDEWGITLEMIAILRLRERSEDDAHYRGGYDQSSNKLKRLVEAGKYPRDLNADGTVRTWRTEWN